ncbi:MAG TPA: hypothetical protein VGV68_03825 [Terriglobia bacterium]|nr:hypothetical protein [Terriglobia bacterium]
MKQLPGILLIMAAVSLGIGLVVRLIQTASGLVRPAFLDPVFYWRGAMAFLAIAIVIVLIQIRDK